MDSQLYIRNVVTLEYDSSKCNGCGLCVQVCPHGVFKMENKKAVITNRDFCMECGACAMNCKEFAISVNKGVGCASAVLNGLLRKTEPSCGCSTGSSSVGGCSTSCN
jgi:NAD-dependent dihydropyrimidine dehydrogenase PreA subunit